MREIRYVLENIHTNKIHFKWYTIGQLEMHGFTKLFDIENYKILHRDSFTGLKNKNGKGNKVFESDLFEVIFESIVGYKLITVIGEVVFKFGGFQVEIMHPEYKELRYFDLFKLLKNPEKEIIGNIHQDKNLLK